MHAQAINLDDVRQCAARENFADIWGPLCDYRVYRRLGLADELDAAQATSRP